jgi:glycerol-3-phosphate cytidylyltransferase
LSPEATVLFSLFGPVTNSRRRQQAPFSQLSQDRPEALLDRSLDFTMKNVLTYGTFDLYHVGHVRLLQRARSFGDRLFVGLSTEAFNQIKGKKSVFTYEERKEILESVRYVDFVFPESTWEQKIDDIKGFKIDVFVIGEDWQGEFDFLKTFCEVVYLPRTGGVSTTLIKESRNRAPSDPATFPKLSPKAAVLH